MAESRLHKIIYLAIVLMLLALAVPFFVPSVQAATVVTLLPNEAGDETVLTTSPEATTNWECVKVNDGDGSYVFSGSGTVQRDLYRLADISLSGTINSVTVHGICKGTKPGDGARFSIKINGTVYDGTEISVALEYAEFSSQWTTNPSGGNWSWEDINALQAGVGLKKPTGGAEARCTQLRVVVDYSADVTAPTGTLSVVTDPIYEGDLVQVVTVTYDEQMNTGSTPTISFSGATGAINTESDGAWSGGDTWTETFTVIDADEETATVTVSSLEATDVVGNPEGSCVTDTFAIDTAALTIVSITSGATAAGVLKVGDTITFTLTPDATEAGATVSGSYNSVDLTWSTTDGGVTYTTTYTISESDTDQTSALQITGVTITDAAGNVSATASGSDVAKTIDSERKCKCTNYDIKFVKVTYDTDTNKSKFTYEVIEYGDPGISHFTLVLSGEAYDYVSSNLRDDNEYYELVSPDPNTGAGGLKRDEVEIVRYEGSGRETYSFTLDGKWTGASSIVAGEAVVKAGSDCICTLRVNVPVCPVPVARDNTHVIDEDTGISIEVLDNDDLGDKPTTITEVTQGENGGVSSTETTTTYTPNPDFNGTDSYTYTITDSNNETDTAIVTITITPINDAPVAVADAYSTNEDTTLNVSAAGVLNNDSDVDGDGLGSSVLSGPSNGTLTLDGDGSFTYTPNENFNGADSFTYSANDGNGGSDQATVTITVNDVNDVPVANNDSTSTPEDIAVDINVVANDTDVDGTIDATTVTVISAATNGSVSVDTTTGLVTYTPNADYNGPDSLTYTVNDDDNSTSNEATITITVTAVNDVPVVSDIPGQTVNEDTLFATISLDDYVTDVDNTDAGMSWSYSLSHRLEQIRDDHLHRHRS
jgi:VCBS repeat-containing protein